MSGLRAHTCEECFVKHRIFRGKQRNGGILELQTQQVLDQVTLLAISQTQVHACVVVIYDGVQISESPIVIETSFEVRGDGPNGRSSIPMVRPSVGLKAVNANVACSVQVPARFGP